MIGVQGKRCMWRALRALELDLEIPGRLDLQGLEEQALSQWARIESVRQLRLPDTFAARRPRSSPGVPDGER